MCEWSLALSQRLLVSQCCLGGLDESGLCEWLREGEARCVEGDGAQCGQGSLGQYGAPVLGIVQGEQALQVTLVEEGGLQRWGTGKGTGDMQDGGEIPQ